MINLVAVCVGWTGVGEGRKINGVVFPVDQTNEAVNQCGGRRDEKAGMDMESLQKQLFERES